MIDDILGFGMKLREISSYKQSRLDNVLPAVMSLEIHDVGVAQVFAPTIYRVRGFHSRVWKSGWETVYCHEQYHLIDLLMNRYTSIEICAGAGGKLWDWN